MILLKTEVKFKNDFSELKDIVPKCGIKEGMEYPELIWKLWTSKEKTACGFYLFESKAGAYKFTGGVKEILESMETAEKTDISAYGVLEEMSRLTRLPIGITEKKNENTLRNETTILLQVRFDIPKIAARLSTSMADRLYPRKTAYHLLDMPGFIWKIWGMKENSSESSGFYLFDSEENVRKRIAHVMEAFPKKPWISNVRCETYYVESELSRMTNAPIDLPVT